MRDKKMIAVNRSVQRIKSQVGKTPKKVLWKKFFCLFRKNWYLKGH